MIVPAIVNMLFVLAGFITGLRRKNPGVNRGMLVIRQRVRYLSSTSLSCTERQGSHVVDS